MLFFSVIVFFSFIVLKFRKIKDMHVFALTSISGILAYVWLILVLLVISPNVVDLWEAILTFMMFPVLIVSAYAADRGLWCRPRNKTSAQIEIALGKFR